ncbi:hypothetical protein ACEQ8H_002249 [Pleosporales sp. CAS-2024a]
MPSPVHQKYSSQSHKIFGDNPVPDMPQAPKQDAERRASDSSMNSTSGSFDGRRRSSTTQRYANLHALKRPENEEHVARRASLQDSYGKVGFIGSLWNRTQTHPTDLVLRHEIRCLRLILHPASKLYVDDIAIMASAQMRSPQSSSDTTSINLNRLLSRLERVVLQEPTPQLRKSSYERARVSANIEHARTLLLNLEHSASTIPSKTKKTALQADLQNKRDVIKQLHQRIHELGQLDDTDSRGSIDSDEEDLDEIPSYAPRVEADAGRELTTSSQGNEALRSAAENLTSSIRRRGKPEDKEGVQTASGNSLFQAKGSSTTGNASHAKTEALLSHNRNEQENLTTSLLDMARQLKQQSMHFGQTLEGDKGILDRAVSGLDKNQLGMEAASQRMGTLRRMTEGKGMLARIKLYAMIAGLWIAAFLVVFVGPKIRF